MYMGVVWCGTRKRGKTPPFSPVKHPICMQMDITSLKGVLTRPANKEEESTLPPPAVLC